jgi:hypothetical protein
MSTYHRTAQAENSQKGQPQVFTAKEARRARDHYQHLAHVVNRIVNHIISGLDKETAKRFFKPTVFASIHSLHGFLNGRKVSAKNPVIKSHQFVCGHFDYYGDPKNAATFMGSRLDALRAAEVACGREFVTVKRADGRTLLFTSYEGTPLLDAAEWVYLQARSKPDYWKNPAAAITDDLLAAAIARLPTVKEEKQPTSTGENGDTEEPGEQWESGDLMAGVIVKGMWTKVINGAESALIKEFDTGGDPELAALKAANKIVQMGKDIKKRLARERLRAFRHPHDTDDHADVTDTHNSGKDSDHSSGGGSPDVEAPDPREFSLGSEPETLQAQQVSKNDFLASPPETPPPTRLAVALDYASQGLPVLPLWGVADGICDCSHGSECRSAGKHPHSLLARNGVYNATTDEKSIREWFKKDPLINLGLAMGGELNLICVDIDPRNDGDASYCDLVEAHGDDAFPDTFTVKTGGGGWHRLYKLPEVIKPKTGELKGKLAPGIDIKGTGGLIVAVGSIHASGRSYRVETNTYIAEAPEWIVNSLRKIVAGEQPEKIIDFQAHRDRKRSGITGAAIVEGERNERLFKIGCAVWGKGEVPSGSELYTRLLDVNQERVSPPLAPSEVVKIAESISGRYPLGVPIQEGTAA